jgi:hypothetical protein
MVGAVAWRQVLLSVLRFYPVAITANATLYMLLLQEQQTGMAWVSSKRNAFPDIAEHCIEKRF